MFGRLLIFYLAMFSVWALSENNLDPIVRSEHLQRSLITKQQFHQLISDLGSTYEGIVTHHGANLIISADWESNSYQTSFQQVEDNWFVNLYGGLARLPGMSLDAYTVLVCHELGHHLAGYPNRNWQSYEGQADYFATHTCVKQAWQHEEPMADRHQLADQKITYLCDSNWSQSKERALCYRSLSASLTLMKVFARGNPIDIDTPDKTIAKKTVTSAPNTQCRLDTLVAGALCKTQFDPLVIPKDFDQAAEYSCIGGEVTIGKRPSCWFASH